MSIVIVGARGRFVVVLATIDLDHSNRGCLIVGRRFLRELGIMALRSWCLGMRLIRHLALRLGCVKVPFRR